MGIRPGRHFGHNNNGGPMYYNYLRDDIWIKYIIWMEDQYIIITSVNDIGMNTLMLMEDQYIIITLQIVL